jgi:hypothetical protein
MLTQTMTTSFKAQILQGVHDLSTDVIKIALYTSNATLNADTTVYTATEEVVGTGYTAGGLVATGITINTSDGVAYVGFSNAVWNPASFTAFGALIYNSSAANKSVAVLSFGSDKASGTSFTIQMPSNNATDALLRIS